MKLPFPELSLCIVFLVAAASSRANTDELPPLAAEFETRTIVSALKPQEYTHHWHFVRHPKRIEKQSPESNSSEIWRLNGKRHISYEKVSHAHKAVIEYNSSDLKSISQYPQWRMLSTILPDSIRHKLKHEEDTRYLNHEASLYKGHINGRDVELLWLNDLNLPAVYRETLQQRETQIKLKALHAIDIVSWAKTETAGYEFFDFSDVGDDEANPILGEMSRHHH